MLSNFLDSKEIVRTEVHSEHVYSQRYHFFHFYNNGSSKEINIYLNSNHASLLEMHISPNKYSYPPLETKPLKSMKGVDSIMMTLTS